MMWKGAGIERRDFWRAHFVGEHIGRVPKSIWFAIGFAFGFWAGR